MRERKPIEEIIYAVFEVVLAILMLVIFLFILITHGQVEALIDLMFVFGILMNVLSGAFNHYKGRKRLAALHIGIAAVCLVFIII
ncbi:MAG: hypothetical protein Q4A32_09830 [Lachnospiraceae bacterium]|nr:hypothetical protein [Lachnospiraceae bacterium]